MKRTRDETIPPVVSKDGSVPSVGTGVEEDPGGRSTVNSKSSEGDAAASTVADTDASNIALPPSSSASSDEPPSSKKKAAMATTSGPSEKLEDDRDSSTGSTPTAASKSGAGGGAGEGAAAVAGGAAAGVEVEAPPDVEGIPNETLFVGNLSYRVSEAVIIKLFTPFGKVVREQFCYHMVGPRRGEPRGFCFVEYSNCEDAAKAIRALHGRKLYGRPLRVRFMTVEGRGRMDYSTDSKSGGSSSSFIANSDGGKIPPPAGAGADAGAGAGVTKLALDKKVALLKLKLREAQQQSGTR